MSPAHRTTCLAGLGLSALMWTAFVAIQALHAEPVTMPLVALLITGFVFFSVLATSRILTSLAAAASLLPLLLLLAGTVTGDGHSEAPLPVRLVIWCWALFQGYVAVSLALRTVSLSPSLPSSE